MRSSLQCFALAALLFGAAGCAQTFDATTLGVPATLAAEGAQAPQGTAFEVKAKALWGIWGLVPLSQPNLQRVLAGQLVGGRAIANVRIKTRTSFTDGLISIISVGLLVPRSVTYEGVVVETPTP